MHSPAADTLFITLWILGAVILASLTYAGLMRGLDCLHRRALRRRGDFRHYL